MKSKIASTLRSLMLVLAFTASSSPSDAVTLADLQAPNASLSSGNLVFFNFTNIRQIGDLNVPLNQINVEPIAPGAGQPDYGIRFSSSLWNLRGPGLFYDIAFDFHVITLTGEALITDNTLTFGGQFTGGGFSAIAETVLDFDTQRSLADKMVFMDQQGQHLSDHQVFPGGPYSHLEISKDFVMTTSGADSGISITHFDQTFSQAPEGGPGLVFTFAAFAGICWMTRGRLGKSSSASRKTSRAS